MTTSDAPTRGPADDGAARPDEARVTDTVLLVASTAALALGGVLHLAGLGSAAHGVWAATTVLGIVPATWWVIDAARQRRLGVDVIAVLALVGTLVVGEYLAGAVITVMLASGRTLEARAAARARRELRALLERAPRVVHRYADGELTTPPLEAVQRGDLLLVQPGEVVPVDGRVERDVAVLDESALTGEPLPVEHEAGRRGPQRRGERGRPVRPAGDDHGEPRARTPGSSGSSPRPRRRARRSSGSPIGTPAVFLVVSLALAGAAWAISGDLVRAVAVLVVATPCPLILAAPVAIVSGLSRAARRGVVVKGGAALEQLARGEILLFDKTGTITAGQARGDRGRDRRQRRVRRGAAARGVARPGVARTCSRPRWCAPRVARSLALTLPTDVEEVPGHGVRGVCRRPPGRGRQGELGRRGVASAALGTDRAPARRARRRAHGLRASRRCPGRARCCWTTRSGPTPRARSASCGATASAAS